MPKRSSRPSKPPADENVAARAVLRQIIAKSDPDAEPVSTGKNPAAVALGRLGGLKGGKARAAQLSATERSAIASQAARARWSKREE